MLSSFLSTWGLRLALLAVWFVAGYTTGLRHEQQRQQAEASRQWVAQIRKERKSTQITVQAEANSAARQERQRVIYRTIEKEVVRYEAMPVEHVDLPGAWRVRHDAAATAMPLPDSTAGLDAAAQPVADTAALDVVTGNYATCNAIAGQLTELQAWVQAQSQEE